jgi:hypothetical protein
MSRKLLKFRPANTVKFKSGQDRQGVIFEGSIKLGELKKITSSTGNIEFSYKETNDDRSYGNNHKRCKGGTIIHVP